MSYFTFTIPPTAGGGDFVMRRLTVGETEDVLEAAQGPKGAVHVTGELVRRALYSHNGVQIPVGMQGEVWWRELDARVGALMSAAYGKIHATTEAEDASFFASMAVSHEPPKRL